MIICILAATFAIAYILIITSLNAELTNRKFVGLKMIFLLTNLIVCIIELVESNLIVSSFTSFIAFLVLFLCAAQIILFFYFVEDD